MKIVAIADNVIVKEDKKEETTAGGIVLPDNYWRDKIIGSVVAVGPGPRRNNGGEMQCKV